MWISIKKMWISKQKMSIFAVATSKLFNIKTTLGLFSKDSYLTKNNTPSMPLLDAHLGGFFFY